MSNSKRWKPTDKEIHEMGILSGYGLTQESIAHFYGISYITFLTASKKNDAMRQSLSKGIANAAARVTKTAYEMAVSGKVPVMTIFWLKTRQRWKEPIEIEHKGLENPTEKSMELISELRQLLEEHKEWKKPSA